MALIILSVADFQSSSSPFDPADDVIIRDAGEKISTLDFSAVDARGVDVLEGTSGVTLNVAQAKELAASNLMFGFGGMVTIVDSGANLATLTGHELNVLGDKRVNVMDATDDALELTISQYTFDFESDAFGVGLAPGDVVTVRDTGANFQLLWPWGWNFTSPYIDKLDVTDNVLRIGDAQAWYLADSNISFAAEDQITVEGDVASFSAVQIASLGDRGVDYFDASGDFALNADQANAIAGSGIGFVGAAEVTVADTGAALFSLSATAIARLADRGVDAIDATDNALTFTVAQFQALGPIVLSGDDVVTLLSDKSYVLPDGVADLILIKGACAGTGNSLDNTITGNSAANRLDGGLGADTMIGGAGNETYVVDHAGDKLVEVASGGKADRAYTSASYTLPLHVENLYARGTGALELTGTKLANVISGNAGDNLINGRCGSDLLIGGAGQDTFLFDTKLSKKNNFDEIADFNVKDDALWFDNAVFKKLGQGSESNPGKVSKAFFTIGDEAKDANDYLIYNKKTGILFYDADGSGAGKAIEVVKLDKKLKLAATDLFVV